MLHQSHTISIVLESNVRDGKKMPVITLRVHRRDMGEMSEMTVVGMSVGVGVGVGALEGGAQRRCSKELRRQHRRHAGLIVLETEGEEQMRECVADNIEDVLQEDCVTKFHTDSIYQFTDDTTILGQISDNNETEYKKNIECLAVQCKETNLSINVSKTKELVSDFRKQSGGHAPVCSNGAEEMAKSVRFLGGMTTNNLSWSIHIDPM
eukprot:g34084.t1